MRKTMTIGHVDHGKTALTAAIIREAEQARLAQLLEMLVNGNLNQHDLAELAVLRHRFGK